MRLLSTYFICLFLGLASTNLHSEKSPTVFVSQGCDLSIDNLDDLHICEGDDFNLCAVINTSYPDYDIEWLENNISTSYDLCGDNPVVNQTTTFTIIVTVDDPINLIENGDFSGGDSGFNTDYDDGQVTCPNGGSGYLTCAGTYAILSNPNDGHTGFASCSWDGNMMVLNGAPAFENVWCQEVCIDPDASYTLSAVGFSVTGSNTANLEFLVDGSVIGSMPLGSVCDDEFFQEDWQATGQTNVEICIKNQNGSGGGNDFAIDDIAFYQVCHRSAEFEVTVSDLEIFGFDAPPINCALEEVDIEIEIYTDFNVQSIDWDTPDGNIVQTSNNDLIITVDEPGTYEVIVIDEFGCQYFEEFYVELELDLPDLFLTPFPTAILSCNTPSVEIETNTNISDGIYLWENENGNMVGMDDTFTATLPGEYSVTITDPNNGCEHYEDVEVILDNNVPDFDLVSSNELTCNFPSATINTTIPYPNVMWTSDLLVPISMTNDTISVSQPAIYYATVVTSSGCTHIDTIQVFEIIPNFVYTEDLSPDLNCTIPSADISVQFDSNLFSIQWTGNAASNGNNTTLTVTQEGNYTYQIIDNLGCVMVDEIIVNADFAAPAAAFTGADLSCAQPTAPLTIADPNNNLTVDWLDPNSNPTNNQDQIIAQQPGTYTYTVTSANGCTTEGMTTVNTVGDFPSATIAGDNLDCNLTTVTLIPNTLDDIVDYTWTLPDGTIVNIQDLNASLPGTYQLQITDANGCISSFPYQVDQDIDLPVIDPLSTLVLDCNTPNLLTDVNIISAYSAVAWTGPNTSSNDLNINITEAGTYTVEVIGENGCISNASLRVTEDIIEPDFLISPPNVLDCDFPSFIASVTVGGPYDLITWTAPSGSTQTGQDANINEAGLHEITVVGINGCVKTEDYLVDQNVQLPEFNIEATPINCLNTESEITVTSTANLSGTEFLQGGITLGTGNATFVSTADQVTVIVTDANGCTSQSFITPDIDTAQVNYTLNANMLGCHLNGTQIELNTQENILSTVVLDSNNLPLGDINTFITTPGDYMVVAIGENGCESSQSIAIGSDFATVAFSVAPVELSCDVPSAPLPLITLDLYETAQLFDDNNQLLDEVDELTELTVNKPGDYTIIVTAYNGCTSEQNVSVTRDETAPAFSVDAGFLDCNTTSTPISFSTLNPYASAELLSPSGQTLETITLNQSFAEVTETGLYTVLLTGENGCMHTEEILVRIDTSTLVFSVDGGTINCNNDPVEINITSTENYATGWIITPQQSQEPLLVGTPLWANEIGTYEVYLEGSNGCISSRSLVISENTDVPDFTSFNTETLTCDGSGRLNNLNVTGGIAPYIINIDGTPQQDTLYGSYEVYGLGNHTLDITDANGCRLDTSFTLIALSELETGITPEITIMERDDLQLFLEINRPQEEIAEIQWLPKESLTCYDCIDPQFIGTDTSNYQITVTDIFGCEQVIELRIIVQKIVEEFPVRIYIPNVISLNNTNDSNGFFTIFDDRIDITIINELSVYDRWGNQVFLNTDFLPNVGELGWKGTNRDGFAQPGVYVYVAKVTYRTGEEEVWVGDVTLLK